MSFFDIGNGCNSCSTFSPVGDMSMNNLTQLDNNTNYLANMVATGVMNNSNNTVNGGSLNQYPNQGGQQLSTMNMSNHFTNSGGNNTASNNNNNNNNMNTSGGGMSTSINNLPQQRQNQQPMVNKKQMVNKKYKYENELEDDGMNGGDAGMASGSNFYIMSGLIFIIALSWHETIKFYINQSIKLNDGSPSLYIGYSVVATLIGFALYHYITKP